MPSPSPDSPSLPFTTPLELAIGGKLKVEPEDFVVEEIPAYEPSGAGEHRFLWVQKRDVSAEHLLGHLARRLGIPREEIGMAGLKDRRAVTRQWVSVPAAVSSKVGDVDDESIQVLRSALHGNKLKTGHLRANRFEIVVREVTADALQIAEEIRALIEVRGVPNYFGDQRFGIDGETLELGMSLLTGKVSPREIPFKRRKFLTRLALSAAQSSLFNEVVRQRLETGTLQKVQIGDVMQVALSGGLFVAEDVEAEQPRCTQGETLITGPIFGPKMKSPLGAPFELEQDVLKSAGLSRDVFRAHKKLTPGTRRPLLLFPSDFQISKIESGIRISFSIPSGAYATVVLREFMKTPEV
ncbi:tRNA pseudouridine(13) synthase TruD [Planctomicrobium sp. SH661]|uniref:tRNA pseudouridine(13) synthase TruD n=1 Tax=Planctomicrobium sp. SH661 TaxID=3448124 RepID=UPI003F5B65FA